MVAILRGSQYCSEICQSLILMRLERKQALLVDGIHAEVDVVILDDHGHETAIGSPVNQMGIVLTQVELLKTLKLILIRTKETLAQDELLRASHQLD